MWQTIIIPMLLGFAIFMCGMKLMELALHRMAGNYLEKFLHRFTRTPVHSLIVGTVSTALLQSSTAVSVISIGMVNSGILTFTRTIGIILGTNIGSVVTTELIGLQINRLAIPLLTIAFAAWLLTALLGEMGIIPFYNSKTWLKHIRSASVALGGFGLLLAGLTVMQSTGTAVSESSLFHWLLTQSETSLWWGLLAGTVMTALVHSSTAVIGLVMGFTMIGTMPVELSIAIVLGANIGTCGTALMASIGGTKAGYYVALSHVLLNVTGALLFMPFIDLLIHISDSLSHSPSSHIARAQTIFNIASSLMALPLCYTKWLQKIDPSR